MLRTQPHFIQPFQKALCLCAIGGLLCFGLSPTIHAKKPDKINIDNKYRNFVVESSSTIRQNSNPCPLPSNRIPIKTPQDIQKLNIILSKSTSNKCYVVPVLDPSIRIPNPVIKITKENFDEFNKVLMKAVTPNNKTVPKLPTNPITIEQFNRLNNQIKCHQNNGIVITDPLKKLPKCP